MMVMPTLLFSRFPTTSYQTAEDSEKQQGSNSSTKTDDKRFVVIYPGFHFSANSTSFALPIVTFASSATRGSVEKILLH